MTILREMGERPTLTRALEAWGRFKLERGENERGRALLEQAKAARKVMRGDRDEGAVHEARTIRRQYVPPTPGGAQVLSDPRKKS